MTAPGGGGGGRRVLGRTRARPPRWPAWAPTGPTPRSPPRRAGTGRDRGCRCSRRGRAGRRRLPRAARASWPSGSGSGASRTRPRWFGLRRGTAGGHLGHACAAGSSVGWPPPWHPVGIFGGDPVAVGRRRARAGSGPAAGRASPGQADVGVIGVPSRTPYSVDCPTNPVLAAWTGLAGIFGATPAPRWSGTGGALIALPPARQRLLPAATTPRTSTSSPRC